MKLLPAFAMLSSADIAENDLLAQMRTLGVEQGTQDQLLPHTIQHGDDKLWFSSPEVVLGLEPGGENEAQTLRYALALGSPARTRIEAFYGRSDGSRRLAIEFALRLGDKWPCLIESEQGDLVSIAEVRKRYEADPAHTDLTNLSAT